MSTETTIEMWVAYDTKLHGFITRSHSRTDNFAKARVYAKKGHVTNSCGTAAIVNGTVLPVPIQVSIDSETLMMLKLGSTLRKV